MIRLPLNKSVLVTIFLFVVIFFVLQFYYVNFVCKLYSYAGFIYKFSYVKYIESGFFLIIYLLSLFYLQKKSSFIYALYVVLGLFLLIPNYVMYAFSDTYRIVFYSINIFFFFIAVISPRKFKIRTVYMDSRVEYYLFIIFAIIIFIPIFNDFRFNINVNVLTFSDIYSTRAIFKSHLSKISSYFYTWEVKVVAPIMLIYSMIRKNKLLALISLLILLYIFLVSGQKSVYMTPVALLIFYFLGKTYEKKINIMLTSLLFALFAFHFIDTYIEHNLFQSIFVRRVFFIPALLNQYYFEFFTHNYMYLSHSIFSPFIENRYHLDPSLLIGLEYYGSAKVSANNGIVADGYMNFGMTGVAIYSFLFSVMLMFLNSINFDKRYFGIFVIYMMTFRGSAFLTVMLTHGFLILLVLAFFILKDKKNIYI